MHNFGEFQFYLSGIKWEHFCYDKSFVSESAPLELEVF